jgi:hypothetical protein
MTKHIRELFRSPEWCPLTIDFKRRVLTLIRLTPGLDQEYLFLALHAARRRGADLREVRLDDAIFAAADARPTTTSVHYILHTAYCCSTLLARYFELIANCIVYKEPELLAQIALAEDNSSQWKDSLDIGIKLFSRTNLPGQRVVIKAHVPCNTLGEKLLESNENATIIFLIPRLRSFLLAVLKSTDRCNRVRSWNRHVARLGCIPPQLDQVHPESLTNGQSAAYWWAANYFLSEGLRSGPEAKRVMALDADTIPDCPKETASIISNFCKIPLDQQQLESLASNPSIRQYSKDPSRPYDAEVRHQELCELERCWGREASMAIEWLTMQNVSFHQVGDSNGISGKWCK